MPWKKENLHRYPENWLEIRAQVQKLAGDKCEHCGVKNHAIGFREDGEFHRVSKGWARAEFRSRWPKKKFRLPFEIGHGEHGPIVRIFEIVCTTAHLDHTPENCDPSNLRFWCQKCHLEYDAKHHAQNAYQTRRKGRAAADLFEGSP